MAAAIGLTVSGCTHKTIEKILNGTFMMTGSSNHGLPIYRKTEQVSGLDIMLYYWDERDGPACCGWWFGPQVGGDQVWGYHSQRGAGAPPPTGWKVPCDGPVDPRFQVAPIQQQPAAAPQARPPATFQQQAFQQQAPPQQAQQAYQQQAHQQQSRGPDVRMEVEGERRRQEEAKRIEEARRKQEEQREWLAKQKEMHRKKQEEIAEMRRLKQEELRLAQEAKKRVEEEAARQRLEMERQRLEEQQRKQEEQRKRIEEMRKKTEEEQQKRREEQQRKIEEQRKRMEEKKLELARRMEEERQEAERQARIKAEEEEQQAKIRAEEEQRRKEQQEKKAAELRAAGAVRRVIQKVRVATPESIDGLAKDLDDVLKEETDNLGSMLQVLQSDCEKAVDLAKKRIASLAEQRQRAEERRREEEARAEERRRQEEERQRAQEERMQELLQELGVLVNAAESGSIKANLAWIRFKEQDPEASEAAAKAALDAVDAAFSEAMTASKAFSDLVMSNKVILLKDPPRVKPLTDRAQEYNASNNAIMLKVKEARQSMGRRTVAFRKMKSIKALFNKYDEDRDGMLSRKEVLAYAMGEFGHDVPQRCLDAIMKHNAGAEEPGVPVAGFLWVRMAVGVAREVQRDQGRRRERLAQEAQLEAARARLQEQAGEVASKAEGAEQAVAACERQEKELKALARGDSGEGLAKAVAAADELADGARGALEEARARIAGLGGGLGEALRHGLGPLLSAESKKGEGKLGRLEARLKRVETLNRQAREDFTKKKSSGIDRLWLSAVRVIRYNQMLRGMLTSEQMFEELDTKGDGAIDEEEFLAFFDGADKTIRDVPLEQPADEAVQGGGDGAAGGGDEAEGEGAAGRGAAPKGPQDEKRACMAIRRVIQKVRVATPSTFDDLSKELEEVLGRELEATGGQRDKLQVECEKGLQLARKRVEHARKEGKDGDAKDAAPAAPAKEKAEATSAEAAEEPVEVTADELKKLFSCACDDEANTMSKDAFMQFVRTYMRVVKAADLTEGASSSCSKVVRRLAPKEVVEVLRGPLKEEASGQRRIEARAFEDGSRGWVAISDKGAAFLRDGGRTFRVSRETILTEALAPGEAVRKLRVGELLEVLGEPAGAQAGLMRVRVRALFDGAVGFATARGNQGAAFLDLV